MKIVTNTEILNFLGKYGKGVLNLNKDNGNVSTIVYLNGGGDEYTLVWSEEDMSNVKIEDYIIDYRYIERNIDKLKAEGIYNGEDYKGIYNTLVNDLKGLGVCVEAKMSDYLEDDCYNGVTYEIPTDILNKDGLLTKLLLIVNNYNNALKKLI